MTSRPQLGYALVVAAGVLFVLNAGVSRVILRAGVDSATLTTFRVTGSVVVFALGAALGRPAALRPPRGRTLVAVVALGVIGVGVLQWTYFVAIDRLPLGVALLLEYTAPVLVALWARFVAKQPVRDRVWLALALSLVGLALVSQVWRGLVLDGIGVAAGLGAALAFAAYFLIGEHTVSSVDPLRVVLWSFLTATVLFNLVQPVTRMGAAVPTASTSMLGGLSAVSVPVWLLLAWVVVLGTVVPFFMELYALQHLPATAVVVVAMVEPVGAAALGWAWFGESLSAVQVAGAAAVVTGILLAQTARAASVPEPLPIG